MKYTYAYKTSDGVRHEDSMNASSRDEVFIELRKRGIKAIKVVAADGSKANGEVRGVRKRVVAVLIAIVALGVGVCAYLGGVLTGGSPESGIAFQTDQSRRQIIGDAAIIEKGIRNGWSDVFELEGERFLASFAIPGVKAGQRNTSEKEFIAALEFRREFSSDDSLEVRQIKAMVEGMKQEARRYLAAGGTVVEYGKRLTERQDAEITIYNRVKADIENARKTMSEAAFMTYWEKRNDELRNLGIKTIGLSDD
ncbi:MAG: hypothetical protein J6N18_09950 [Kiritimatiellae bacterium]|nr:hypothetical protein [Kiritimatiellia bacterium]